MKTWNIAFVVCPTRMATGHGDALGRAGVGPCFEIAFLGEPVGRGSPS